MTSVRRAVLELFASSTAIAAMPISPSGRLSVSSFPVRAHGAIDESILSELEAKDNCFPFLDYRVYANTA